MTALDTNKESPASVGAKDDANPGFGIYRYGQGYWVRTLTAIFTGVLLLAGAGWAWRQLEAISLPKSSWSIRFEGATGTVAAGQPVVLFNDAVQPPLELGNAVTKSAASGEIIIEKVEMKKSDKGEEYTLAEATRIQNSDGSFSASVLDRIGIEIFSKVYLQASVASVILLVGALSIYWLVAARPSSVDFLVDTDGEMKKVNWSTRKHIIDSTWVVVGATFLIAAVLWIFDVMLSRLMTWINVLQS